MSGIGSAIEQSSRLINDVGQENKETQGPTNNLQVELDRREVQSSCINFPYLLLEFCLGKECNVSHKWKWK